MEAFTIFVKVDYSFNWTELSGINIVAELLEVSHRVESVEIHQQQCIYIFQRFSTDEAFPAAVATNR